ncbi:MAG: metallophosphoesterase [Ferruginibacter sp.]
MKFLLFPGILALFFFQSTAQDYIRHRVILIGDAGETNEEQKAVLQDAVKQNIPGKTIAIFLGDNIYPKGMELPGTKGAVETEQILRSQYEGLRRAGIPVFFVPGNHDWDKSGPKGYEKILRVNRFLKEQKDSLLQMIPKDACPGPYELSLSDNLLLVAMDSEWWLYPFASKREGADCECKSKRDILGKLKDILQRNRNKIILFATHHPFNSYGSHGGYYSLKEHIFPLTDLNKNLYIPFPVIGSLYPLLRKVFPRGGS